MWNRIKKVNWSKILFWFVLISLLFSLAFAIGHLILAPAHTADGAPHQKLKSDYVLVIFQCLLGIVVIFLPSILERRFKIEISESMHVVFIIFLYGAIYLGEVRNFYYLVPNWDSIQHTLSGGMLGALGFSVVDFLNKNKKVSLQLSPLFVALFAFCFAVTLGTLWEIYEYASDGIFGLNMQKFMLEDGTQLVGHAALRDTMKDLIVDCVGAFCICSCGYLARIKNNKFLFQTILEVETGDEGMDAKEKPADLAQTEEHREALGGERLP